MCQFGTKLILKENRSQGHKNDARERHRTTGTATEQTKNRETEEHSKQERKQTEKQTTTKTTKKQKFTNGVLVRALGTKPGWIEIFCLQETAQTVR